MASLCPSAKNFILTPLMCFWMLKSDWFLTPTLSATIRNRPMPSILTAIPLCNARCISPVNCWRTPSTSPSVNDEFWHICCAISFVPTVPSVTVWAYHLPYELFVLFLYFFNLISIAMVFMVLLKWLLIKFVVFQRCKDSF